MHATPMAKAPFQPDCSSVTKSPAKASCRQPSPLRKRAPCPKHSPSDLGENALRCKLGLPKHPLHQLTRPCRIALHETVEHGHVADAQAPAQERVAQLDQAPPGADAVDHREGQVVLSTPNPCERAATLRSRAEKPLVLFSRFRHGREMSPSESHHLHKPLGPRTLQLQVLSAAADAGEEEAGHKLATTHMRHLCTAHSIAKLLSLVFHEPKRHAENAVNVGGHGVLWLLLFFPVSGRRLLGACAAPHLLSKISRDHSIYETITGAALRPRSEGFAPSFHHARMFGRLRPMSAR
mmetsp:Transcript_16242/g.61879  ORF Transcript_16242/g.61879 Transcript_16242/m.61879 type:complete len:294 (+) Transcript_16242:1004-1885(+)